MQINDKEIQDAMDLSKKKVGRNFKEGVKEVALRILASAKINLKENGSIATGALSASGGIKEGSDYLDTGFYASYAYWIEYGRKSGTSPPVDEIYQWVRVKHLVSDKDAMSVAWAIKKTIERKGTKPKPFLQPAYKEFESRYEDIIKKKIDEK